MNISFFFCFLQKSGSFFGSSKLIVSTRPSSLSLPFSQAHHQRHLPNRSLPSLPSLPHRHSLPLPRSSALSNPPSNETRRSCSFRLLLPPPTFFLFLFILHQHFSPCYRPLRSPGSNASPAPTEPSQSPFTSQPFSVPVPLPPTTPTPTLVRSSSCSSTTTNRRSSCPVRSVNLPLPSQPQLCPRRIHRAGDHFPLALVGIHGIENNFFFFPK